MSATGTGTEAVIEQLQVAAYRIPTDAPEADSTFLLGPYHPRHRRDIRGRPAGIRL